MILAQNDDWEVAIFHTSNECDQRWKMEESGWERMQGDEACWVLRRPRPPAPPAAAPPVPTPAELIDQFISAAQMVAELPAHKGRVASLISSAVMAVQIELDYARRLAQQYGLIP